MERVRSEAGERAAAGVGGFDHTMWCSLTSVIICDTGRR